MAENLKNLYPGTETPIDKKQNVKFYTEKCGFHIVSTEIDGNVEIARFVAEREIPFFTEGKKMLQILNAGNRIMNTYVYKAPAGFVMVDTGYEHSMKNVERKLRSSALSFSDIKYVFLTHAHDDHAGFLNELMNKYPDIQVIINPESIPVLRKGQNRFDGGCSSLMAYVFCKMMSLWGKGKHLFPKIDEHNIERMTKIDDSNRKQLEELLGGRIIYTPGHTNDSISLKIGERVFCGDAAMNGFPSSHRITIWVGNTSDFETSWEKLLDEDIRFVIPAHGKPFPVENLQKNIGFISQIKLRAL